MPTVDQESSAGAEEQKVTSTDAAASEQTAESTETAAVETKETTAVAEPTAAPEPVAAPAPAPAPVAVKAVVQPKVIAQPTTVATKTVQAAPAPAPVAQPVVQAAAPAPAPAVAAFDMQAQIKDLSLTAQLALQNIASYAEVMAPKKPISIEDGNRQQIALYRAISTIINKLEGDFEPAFTVLLKFFEHHKKGVFAETHAFRFFDTMPMVEDDRKALMRLLNMIKVLAPVQGRQLALKQVDLNNSLQFGVTEAGKQRVLEYFGK